MLEVLSDLDTLWLRAQTALIEVRGSASLCTMCSAGSDQQLFAVWHVQNEVIAALEGAPHDQWSPSAGAAAGPGIAARLPQPLHPPPAPAQAVRAQTPPDFKATLASSGTATGDQVGNIVRSEMLKFWCKFKGQVPTEADSLSCLHASA